MNELEIFNILLSKDPTPGISNRIKRIDNMYEIPGWVFGLYNEVDETVKVKYKKLDKTVRDLGYTDQIVYDILILGLTNIDERPKCPICGNTSRYENFTRGYQKTCGNDVCIHTSIQSTVKSLWDNEEYKETQIKSHLLWCSNEENIQKMRELSLDVWKRDGYREKQIKSHKEFAKNNPEKLRSGNYGTQECSKAKDMKLHYDSSWEQKFIIFCDECDKISSINRPDFCIPYTYLGTDFTYYPDFVVILQNGAKILFEIKPDYLLNDKKTQSKIIAAGNYVQKDMYYIVLTETTLFMDASCKKINISSLMNLINKLNKTY